MVLIFKYFLSISSSYILYLTFILIFFQILKTQIIGHLKGKFLITKIPFDQSFKNLIKEMNSLPDAPIFFVCFVAKRDFHWQQQFDSKGHNLNKYTSSTLSLCLIFCCILLFIVACYIYLFAVIIIQLYLL